MLCTTAPRIRTLLQHGSPTGLAIPRLCGLRLCSSEAKQQREEMVREYKQRVLQRASMHNEYIKHQLKRGQLHDFRELAQSKLGKVRRAAAMHRGMQLMHPAAQVFPTSHGVAPVQAALHFPFLKCKTLAGRRVVLPTDIAGRVTLVLLLPSEFARQLGEPWAVEFRKQFAGEPLAQALTVFTFDTLAFRLMRPLVALTHKYRVPRELHDTTLCGRRNMVGTRARTHARARALGCSAHAELRMSSCAIVLAGFFRQHGHCEPARRAGVLAGHGWPRPLAVRVSRRGSTRAGVVPAHSQPLTAALAAAARRVGRTRARLISWCAPRIACCRTHSRQGW